MYERRHHRMISGRRFTLRLLAHAGAAIGLLLMSLFGGMYGYSYFEHLPWRDAFLNSAMLLGGMGPVDPPHTPDGKVFEGLFALYAGIVFLFTAGVVIAPILHRILHHFHIADDKDKSS